MIDLVRRVIAGEGVASAMRRARGRALEAITQCLLLLRGRFVRELPTFPILNILSTPATPRLGGIQIHLLARLRAERALRPVALLTPGTLFLSQPRPHARRVRANDGAFVDAVHEAIAITGARVLHIEGAYGIPVDGVLRLIDEGLDVVLSLHDFALIADDPHHLHPPSAPHLLGRKLLQRARAVVYPSRFLELAHDHPGAIIPAGIPPVERPTRSKHAHPPRIAFAGSVQPRKGAHLIRPIVESLRGRGIEWFVFGGGNTDVLNALRTETDVRIHGQYAMGELPQLLAKNDIDLVLLLSIEPELYSLTLSESWLAGVPVLAFAHGAIEERVSEEGGGVLVPLEAGASGVVEGIERWLIDRKLPPVPTNIATAEDAARAYAELYHRLLLE
ncbi:MAG TPA: glycosyltransferase [Thermoanaerobaculia bacterium]|jgi:glycosyltransferase involved in cell wall biosynthesis|nr:glycosyltransferase [Thermoanaerobaculia bacterium]